MRPIRHRLHQSPDLDDLGIYVSPHPLDVGDTLTLDDARRFRVVDRIDFEVSDCKVDGLLEVVSVRSSLGETIESPPRDRDDDRARVTERELPFQCPVRGQRVAAY